MLLPIYFSFVKCCSPFNKYRKEFFKEVGEVVDVRLATFEDGALRGFGHVEFASPEAAQKVFIFLLLSYWVFCFANLVDIPLLLSELIL